MFREWVFDGEYLGSNWICGLGRGWGVGVVDVWMVFDG